jgi:hypothetical protein
MARFISKPTVIPAAGEPPKIIEEFIGNVNSGTPMISIAKMTSPSGWSEPGQTPEFDEYTIVLRANYRLRPARRFIRLARVRRSLLTAANGCVTARPVRRVRNTSPSVCPLLRQRPCTGTQSGDRSQFCFRKNGPPQRFQSLTKRGQLLERRPQLSRWSRQIRRGRHLRVYAEPIARR